MTPSDVPDLSRSRYCANPRRGNYFALIEQAAAEALADAGYTGGALSLKLLLSVVSQHGFPLNMFMICLGLRGQ